MFAELKKVRFPVEVGLLLAICFFLPLLEFWKNLALVGYGVAWLVNRAKTRDFGGSWRTSDSIAALWIGGAYLSAAFAGLDGRAIAKTGDVLASALLFWMVARAGYPDRELRWVQGTLLISLLVGLVVGYWRMWGGIGKTGLLQLYSVGHVNHTAIYIAIMLGVCASWLFATWRAGAGKFRWLLLAFAAIVFASLAPTWSRAAIAAGALVILVVAAAWWPRWRVPLLASLGGVAVAGILLVGVGAEVLRKQSEYVATGKLFSYRDVIWETGLVAWKKYPLFGIGKDNYPLLTSDRIREWRAEAGQPFDAANYLFVPHAHSLYVNTLVERGAVGFIALLAVLGASLHALLRFRPKASDGDIVWLGWGGAAGAWIVTAGVGVVNTTLHHEHGLLAAILLALWLSTLHPRRAS
jgi:O-antigen ligase